MTIHLFNGFTVDARWPSKLKTGLVCALIETGQGLVLIDTGPGLDDYAHPHGILKIFRVLFDVPFDVREAAVNQVQRLGYRPDDVRHIVLSHMHFDHCGGLPDFPHATVHVHRREYESFSSERLWRWTDLAYVSRHLAQNPEVVLYDSPDGKWYDFDAIRLPFEPEMWLVPLFGHSRGHCGVAVKTGSGWFFNAADSGAVYNNKTPAWLIKMVLGPHDSHLRLFMKAHPEILLVNSHMMPEFFENLNGLAQNPVS